MGHYRTQNTRARTISNDFIISTCFGLISPRQTGYTPDSARGPANAGAKTIAELNF